MGIIIVSNLWVLLLLAAYGSMGIIIVSSLWVLAAYGY